MDPDPTTLLLQDSEEQAENSQEPEEEYDDTQLPSYLEYQSNLQQITNSEYYDPEQSSQDTNSLRSSYMKLKEKLKGNALGNAFFCHF